MLFTNSMVKCFCWMTGKFHLANSNQALTFHRSVCLLINFERGKLEIWICEMVHFRVTQIKTYRQRVSHMYDPYIIAILWRSISLRQLCHHTAFHLSNLPYAINDMQVGIGFSQTSVLYLTQIFFSCHRSLWKCLEKLYQDFGKSIELKS